MEGRTNLWTALCFIRISLPVLEKNKRDYLTIHTQFKVNGKKIDNDHKSCNLMRLGITQYFHRNALGEQTGCNNQTKTGRGEVRSGDDDDDDYWR